MNSILVVKELKMKRRQRTLKEILHKRIVLFILFYIMIIALYFTSVTLSKSAGQLDKNGQVSVARWHVEADLDEKEILKMAKEKIQSKIQGSIAKEIYVKNKIINFVVK